MDGAPNPLRSLLIGNHFSRITEWLNEGLLKDKEGSLEFNRPVGL
jgi:hypothetical protein